VLCFLIKGWWGLAEPSLMMELSRRKIKIVELNLEDPILKPQTREDFWDNVLVRTPYVLAMESGSFKIYYLGVG